MGSTHKARGLISLLALLGVVGVAAAQTTPSTTAPTPPPQLAGGRDVSLTTEQMVAEGKVALPEMDRGAAAVRHQLAEARQRRDVVRVLCLNDKLNQIDLAIRTASDRVEALNSAAALKDADRTRHEFTVTRVLRDRVKTLVSEANQCIGEETGFVGDSRVTVDIDPSLPDEDTDLDDDNPPPPPPVLASPTL